MTKADPGYPGKPKGLRWPLIALIGALHVVALYGLSRFLAPELTASVERSVVEGLTVIVTAPPEPENPTEPDEGASGEPGKEAVPQPVTAPTPTVIERKPEPRPRASSTGAAQTSGAREEGEGTGAQGAGEGTGSGNSGSGQGDGAAIKPSVRSGALDPLRDFPIPEGGRETRFGTSVTVVFTVTTDGRSRDCSVARSTSDAATTALVCGLVSDKIRFNPARNRAGEAVEARYGYRVDFNRR